MSTLWVQQGYIFLRYTPHPPRPNIKLPSTFIDILFQLPKKHNVAFAEYPL